MTTFYRLTVGLAGLYGIGFVALCIASLAALAAAQPLRAGSEPSAERQAELRSLLVQDCGSCHGLTLAGGLGPSLQGPALAGKPEQYLAAIILHGRPGTAMPPWRPFLSDVEAVWLARLLKGEMP
jgi:cytochrome c55X